MQAPAARSYWLRDERNDAARHAPLARDLEVDAAIVGAGITGLTLATLLLEAGLRVALLERRRVAGGTTSRSTAHLTAALDTDYCALERRFGEAALRTVVDSVRGAIDQIERLARGSGGACGFRRLPGFRFSDEEAGALRLEKEVLCARRAGLDVSLVGEIPLGVPCASAMRFEEQGEIDPVAYCEALRERVLRSGGEIFEETPVVEIRDGVARTAAGPCVRARNVIEAVHTAVGVAPSIQTRLGVYTSYVIAARLASPVPRALYWDCADPYHYLRVATGDPRVVLCGGADHRTGREEPTQRLRVLEQWLRSKLPVEAILARWSHELFEPADGLPYIGFLPGSRGRLVAAGFSGTGLTFGTLGAILIRDLVTRGESAWQGVYTPLRLETAERHAAERLRRGPPVEARREPPVEARRRAPGGCLLRTEGEQVAAWRDPEGSLHLHSRLERADEGRYSGGEDERFGRGRHREGEERWGQGGQHERWGQHPEERESWRTRPRREDEWDEGDDEDRGRRFDENEDRDERGRFERRDEYRTRGRYARYAD